MGAGSWAKVEVEMVVRAVSCFVFPFNRHRMGQVEEGEMWVHRFVIPVPVTVVISGNVAVASVGAARFVQRENGVAQCRRGVLVHVCGRWERVVVTTGIVIRSVAVFVVI